MLAAPDSQCACTYIWGAHSVPVACQCTAALHRRHDRDGAGAVTPGAHWHRRRHCTRALSGPHVAPPRAESDCQCQSRHLASFDSDLKFRPKLEQCATASGSLTSGSLAAGRPERPGRGRSLTGSWRPASTVRLSHGATGHGPGAGCHLPLCAHALRHSRFQAFLHLNEAAESTQTTV